MIQSTSDPTHLPDGPIEGLSVTPDCMQVFMFSAVTWNRHHIHYNREQAIEEGLPDVVVQRGLIGNFLARMLNRWIDGRGEVRRLKWQMRRSAVPARVVGWVWQFNLLLKAEWAWLLADTERYCWCSM